MLVDEPSGFVVDLTALAWAAEGAHNHVHLALVSDFKTENNRHSKAQPLITLSGTVALGERSDSRRKVLGRQLAKRR